MEHVNVVPCQQVPLKRYQALVEVVRAERPAEGNEERRAVWDIERGATARTIAREHRCTHGIACELDGRSRCTMLLENLGHTRLGDGDERSTFRRLLVGKSGNRVLLMERVGYAELGGGTHERQFDIGAEPDDHIGAKRWVALEIAYDAPLRTREVHKRGDERPGPFPVEARHVHGREVEPGLGHERASSLRDSP